MIPGEEQDEVPWTADAVLEYINSFESPVDAMQNIADTWNYRNEALDNAIANRNAAETEAERLTAALAECQERALRTMKAQQDENERLRAQVAAIPFEEIVACAWDSINGDCSTGGYPAAVLNWVDRQPHGTNTKEAHA